MTEWRPIPGFYGYNVSDEGTVSSDHTGRILLQSKNREGVYHVGMYTDGHVYRRSVAVLVANAFLEPSKFTYYDTPIHLDGDRSNCAVDNLMWRPRWFAVRYHQQFTDRYRYNDSWLRVPVERVDTGEVFEESIQLCMKYGVLAVDVVMAALRPPDQPDRKIVPIGWFEVRSPENSDDIISRRKHVL